VGWGGVGWSGVEWGGVGWSACEGTVSLFCSAWLEVHTNLILGSLPSENPTDGAQCNAIDPVTETNVFDTTYTLPPKGQSEDMGPKQQCQGQSCSPQSNTLSIEDRKPYIALNCRDQRGDFTVHRSRIRLLDISNILGEGGVTVTDASFVMLCT
jgi:hypothetical protein